MSTSKLYPKSRPLGHGRADPAKTPAKPRDAATLIVWQNGSCGVEVLMGRRSRRSSFVPDFFVFPGGRLDPTDYTVCAATPFDHAPVKCMGVHGNTRIAEALAIAAVRETFEETGPLLAEVGDIGTVTHPDWTDWKARGLAPGLHHLSYFGCAITSRVSPIRFHARFFTARAETLKGKITESNELSELRFYSVTEVLQHLPIVDVTDFMLKRLLICAADPLRFNSRTPGFFYKGDVPYIRYQYALTNTVT
jgi:8-oxo-dGTP pyrophosphatase MutT (NUDIX family)